MNIRFFIGLLLSLCLLSFTSDKAAYQLYNAKGKKTCYSKLLKKAQDADIIFFGELHNNPINHWLQLELAKDLFTQSEDKIILGAEMFEADDQIIVNEYLQGNISYKSFEAEAKLWTNNKTDYQPLLDYALSNQIPFIATNVPRRYASMVYKNGFKGLNNISDEAKKWIAPLPIKYDKTLPGYANMLKMSGGHGGDNLPKAQALKDATMAHFILKNWKEGYTFIHFNGTYHSNNYEGIVWYIKQNNPNINILTINAIEQDSLKKLEEEHINTADFIIGTPSSLTKTY